MFPLSSYVQRKDFYPRPPRGGRRQRSPACVCFLQFLSTPSARRATTLQTERKRFKRISIHALREEGDLCVSVCAVVGSTYFYPRPPRGGRHSSPESLVNDLIFLSTPSARRATCSTGGRNTPSKHFYPRPPRGGRRPILQKDFTSKEFLSTPSARRATWCAVHVRALEELFLSTPSARRATSLSLLTLLPSLNFYPRPPRGGRLQSTGSQHHYYSISIHALREEGDLVV